MGIAGRRAGGKKGFYILVSGRGKASIRCVATVVQVVTPARHGRPCCEGRPGKVTRNSFGCGAWHIMAATVILSIWPERTDAHVGLQVEPIGQLAWWADVGLRSKQGRGRGQCCQ